MVHTDDHGAGKQLTSIVPHMAYAAIAVGNAKIRKNTTVKIQPSQIAPVPIAIRISTKQGGGLDQTVNYTRTKLITKSVGVGER